MKRSARQKATKMERKPKILIRDDHNDKTLGWSMEGTNPNVHCTTIVQRSAKRLFLGCVTCLLAWGGRITQPRESLLANLCTLVHTFSSIQFWQIPVDVGYVHYWQTKFETIPHLPQYWNYAVPNMTKGLYAKNFKMSPTRVRYPARDGSDGAIVMESPLSDMTWASFLLLQWPLSTRAEVHVSAKQGL